MVRPLIQRIAAARAKRDQPSVHSRRCGRQHRKAAVPIGPHRRIRMDHVICARNSKDGLIGVHSRQTNGAGLIGADPKGHGGQPRTGHVILHTVIACRCRMTQNCCGQCPGKGFGENADLHHRVPDTSSSLTGRPSSTDLAIASIPRTEAIPSATLAPVCGVPFSAASANPSNCRR